MMDHSIILDRRGPKVLGECTDSKGNPSHLPNRWFIVKLKKRKYPDWSTARYFRYKSEALEAMEK